MNASNPVVIDATPGQSYADISREFDAPVEAVFRAHADRDLFKAWIGPRSLQNEITHWDFRTGGGYRYEQTDADGNTYAFRGVFHSVRENELLIQTFEYEGMPDEVSLDIMRFESLPGGRSRIVDHSVFPSVEVLEGMMAEGMEGGMNEGYEKLDELLAAGIYMGTVVSSASTSLDGFVAYPNNDPGPLFDWYEAGDVEIVNAGDLPPFHLTKESADYWTGWVSEIGCLVVGRLLFDITDGWKGEHPMGVPFVVVTHDPPTDWAHAHTGNAHFVTGGIEAAIALAKEVAGEKSIGVAAGTIAGQALAAGLLDEVAIDLVPVVLGEGHPYFADVAPDAVRLGDPTVVIRAKRVTHLRFPVLK